MRTSECFLHYEEKKIGAFKTCEVIVNARLGTPNHSEINYHLKG